MDKNDTTFAIFIVLDFLYYLYLVYFDTNYSMLFFIFLI